MVFELQGVKVGMSICEDIWHAGDPIKTETVLGDAEVVLNISASPFHAGKREARQQMLASQARDNAACIAYVNMVGGQDELVFDGNSMIIAPDGGIDRPGPLVCRRSSRGGPRCGHGLQGQTPRPPPEKGKTDHCPPITSPYRACACQRRKK